MVIDSISDNWASVLTFFFIIWNVIFELFRGVFFLKKWVDQISYSHLLGDSSFNFEYFNTLWISNGHSYKSYTRFKFKKFSVQTFRHYEWRNMPRDPCLANSTGEFPTTRHVSNSLIWLAKCLQQVTLSQKSFETDSFWE